jgi:hypothetical protein
MAHKLSVHFELSPQSVMDILTTAIEGGINYWCESFLFEVETGDTSGDGVWDSASYREMCDEPDFLCNARFTIVEIEPSDDGDGRHVRTWEQLKDAFQAMADRDCDSRERMALCNFLSDEYDANDADVLIQWLVWGKVIYG